VTRDTRIPGVTLKPGQYDLHIVDAVSDRMIVRVDSPTSKTRSVFLSILRTPPGTSRPGILSWGAGPNKTPALRGFTFDAGPTIEFVYPKEEAAELAKLNSEEVVAVDYAASNLKSLTGLSEDEMREVNLWLLSLTSTGPADNTPAILAKKYVSPSSSDQQVVAQKSDTATQAQPKTQVAELEKPESPTAASRPVHRARMPAALPHTASNLPILWLIGLLALVSSLAIHFVLRPSRLEAV
jgi:hypothetical protein